MILKHRADIGIVTEAYLADYLAAHPKEKDKFIIAERYDQKSSYDVIVRPGFLPNADRIRQILQGLENKGALKSLSAIRGYSIHHDE